MIEPRPHPRRRIEPRQAPLRHAVDLSAPCPWEVATITDVGLKRTSNQDHVLVDPLSGIFIVADGMGGHRAGERASRMASWHIYRFLRQEMNAEPTGAGDEPFDPDRRWKRALRLALYSANRHVYRYACDHPQYRGMGTTIVTALFREGRCFIAHAGDSRLYRVREGELQRVTRDHSRLQDLMEIYDIPEEAAKRHPFRNVITRSLGNHPDLDVDLNDFEVARDEMILMCTDGLCGVLTDSQMNHVLKAAKGDLRRLCRLLLTAVNRAGAPDNVSIVAVRTRDPHS